MLSILHLGRPTDGDSEYYSRWTKSFLRHQIIPGGSYNGKWEIGYNSAADEITILVVDQYTPVDNDLLSKLPDLEYIVTPTTGLTHLKYDLDKYDYVKVISLKGESEFLENVTGVAEHVFYLIHKLIRESARHPVTLYKKIIGIVGMGRIGTQVDRIAKAYGMQTICCDRKYEHNTLDKLKSLFRISDFVTLHVDENPSSIGMIDRDLIDRMSPYSYLINTSRGSIIDEPYLHNALLGKRIGGAGIDTSDLPPGAWDGLSNVFFTNHTAGRCLENRAKTDSFVIWKLQEAIRIRDLNLSRNRTPEPEKSL